MKNIDLKPIYNDLHKQGSSSWFSTGWEERKGIIEMGEPWAGLNVLEIGCGEGDLCAMMVMAGARHVTGIDYSTEATKQAYNKYQIPNYTIINRDYRDYHNMVFERGNIDRIVMEGVLEHLDDPFSELKWMIDNLLTPEGDIITSSPSFINPRGIVLMTLEKLFDAPITLADLHYLSPWDFEIFCDDNNLECDAISVEFDWAYGQRMVDDLKERLPNVLRDMGMTELGAPKLIEWLQNVVDSVAWEFGDDCPFGAALVHHIKKT